MATPDGFIRLQEELTTDPLVVGYAGMTDIQVSASLRAQTRPGPSTVDQLRAYFLLEKRSGVPLYGRLALVARSNVFSMLYQLHFFYRATLPYEP